MIAHDDYFIHSWIGYSHKGYFDILNSTHAYALREREGEREGGESGRERETERERDRERERQREGRRERDRERERDSAQQHTQVTSSTFSIYHPTCSRYLHLHWFVPFTCFILCNSLFLNFARTVRPVCLPDFVWLEFEPASVPHKETCQAFLHCCLDQGVEQDLLQAVVWVTQYPKERYPQKYLHISQFFRMKIVPTTLIHMI